ncbi:MAG: DUF2218 domain-containing protein [Tropicimonas sp.]|uniref:DUF2218 domain-containing protein n=1 Tax=Tropicimonas sp. TaxID=2067044 RepID=UPI003A84C08B
MLKTTGHFETALGSRYLQQICKHFGHKVEASFDERQGSIRFPFGNVALTTDATRLTIAITAGTEEALATGRNVIDSHLERFAFREAFAGMDWGTPETA